MNNTIWNVLLTAFLGFIVLFVIAKLLGKKQMGELDFTDYVVGISIGSIAAEMATNAEGIPIYHYIVGMLVFFVLTFLIDVLSLKNIFLKKLFIGTPLVIIKDGKFDYTALKKSKLSINDVLMLARKKDIFNIDDIAYAIFETNGELSVLPKSEQTQVVLKDLKIEREEAFLPQNVIVDGEISRFSLEAMEKDENWVYEKLNIKTKKELKNILLAVYIKKDDNFVIHYKS